MTVRSNSVGNWRAGGHCQVAGKPPNLMRNMPYQRGSPIAISWGSIGRNFVNLTIPTLVLHRAILQTVLGLGAAALLSGSLTAVLYDVRSAAFIASRGLRSPAL